MKAVMTQPSPQPDLSVIMEFDPEEGIADLETHLALLKSEADIAGARVANRIRGIFLIREPLSADAATRLSSAAAVLMSLPVILLVLSAQRYLVRGLTLGAVKG